MALYPVVFVFLHFFLGAYTSVTVMFWFADVSGGRSQKKIWDSALVRCKGCCKKTQGEFCKIHMMLEDVVNKKGSTKACRKWLFTTKLYHLFHERGPRTIRTSQADKLTEMASQRGRQVNCTLTEMPSHFSAAHPPDVVCHEPARTPSAETYMRIDTLLRSRSTDSMSARSSARSSDAIMRTASNDAFMSTTSSSLSPRLFTAGCVSHEVRECLPVASRPGLISTVRPDLCQPTHGLVEEDELGVILLQRLKARHLRPKYGVLNGSHYALL